MDASTDPLTVERVDRLLNSDVYMFWFDNGENVPIFLPDFIRLGYEGYFKHTSGGDLDTSCQESCKWYRWIKSVNQYFADMG